MIFIENSPCHTLDLHGYTIAAAFLAVNAFIERGHADGFKFLTIITGRSGVIAKEFPEWMSRNGLVKQSQLQNNRGSYRVFLSKC
jgi:DNA-nicking Smr family endonuclease